jgi:hypothetical protein
MFLESTATTQISFIAERPAIKPIKEKNMQQRQLLSAVEKKFYALLDRKTGWGRTEIKELFKEALLDALIDVLDETHPSISHEDTPDESGGGFDADDPPYTYSEKPPW